MFEIRDSVDLGLTAVVQQVGGRYRAHEAISRALAANKSGLVRIVADGAVRLDKPVTSKRDNLRVELTPRTRIIASQDAAIGAFDFRGFSTHVDGMGGDQGGGAAIVAEHFVPGQVMVRMSGHQSGLRGCKVILNANDGDPATPMVGVKLMDSHLGYVCANLFLPNEGLSCVEVNNLHSTPVENPNASDQAPSVRIMDNLFTSDDPKGATVEPLARKRRCHRGITVAGAGWGRISGNIFTHLGDYADTLGFGASYMDSAIIVQKGIDPTIQLETGHWEIDGNTVEYCNLHRGIQAWSIPTVIVTRNRLWRNEAATSLGDAMLVITGFLGSSFESTPGAGPSLLLPTSGVIAQNDFHNCWFDPSATGILIEGSESLRVVNNTMSLVNNGGIPIRLRGVPSQGAPFFVTSRSRNLVVNNNTFLSQAGPVTAVVVIDPQHELVGTQEMRNNSYSSNFGAFVSGTGTGSGTVSATANTVLAAV